MHTFLKSIITAEVENNMEARTWRNNTGIQGRYSSITARENRQSNFLIENT